MRNQQIVSPPLFKHEGRSPCSLPFRGRAGVGAVRARVFENERSLETPIPRTAAPFIYIDDIGF